jgi:2',3'-cyclic-nucleotide 2'-phosphodiesterase (5'-nucleotidase family)
VPASVVRTDASGNCTGPAVDLTAGSSYTVAMNDFMVVGGDGYGPFAPYTVRDLLDKVVSDYVSANTPVSPFVKAPPDGRINCTGGGCPTVIPSFP